MEFKEREYEVYEPSRKTVIFVSVVCAIVLVLAFIT